jgi:hypothetical protein
VLPHGGTTPVTAVAFVTPEEKRIAEGLPPSQRCVMHREVFGTAHKPALPRHQQNLALCCCTAEALLPCCQRQQRRSTRPHPAGT